MMLTDKVWKLLEPATTIGENLTKENIEKGIDDGTYQIFMDEQSVVITADYQDALRIGLAGGELNSLKKFALPFPNLIVLPFFTLSLM